MRSVLIALCIASLTACDGLSMSQKKPAEAQAAPAAPAPQAKAPEALKVDARVDPRVDADGALATRVKQALEGEPKIHAGGIDVTAAGGAVTLWGTAASAGERARAAKLASGVEGVKSVENKITVVKGS
jgi:hyperosmotically inducible periplasmic protein